MKEPFTFTECSICGKQFIMHPGHMYKVVFAGKTFKCCGYGCYQKAKKVKEDNCSKQYKDIMKVMNNEANN